MDYKDLTFNQLKGIEKTSKKASDGSYFWRWECSCGNIIERLPSYVTKGHTISCGCVKRIPTERLNEITKSSTAIQSLKHRLDKQSRYNPQSGCIEWTGSSLTHGGYGRMSCGRGVNVRAHRVAWVLERGEIPHDMFVCHRCDNPLCVNVEHLFLGTVLDNHVDMVSKGREKFPKGCPKERNPLHLNPELVSGENNPNSKLSDDKVRTIRESHSSLSELAKEYGVSKPTISAILNFKTWKHVK